MNKRLKKKKKVGSWAEIGAHIEGRFDEPISQEHEDIFLDELINFVESINLELFGSVWRNGFSFTVSNPKKYAKISKDELKKIRTFLDKTKAVIIFKLVDLNHDEF